MYYGLISYGLISQLMYYGLITKHTQFLLILLTMFIASSHSQISNLLYLQSIVFTIYCIHNLVIHNDLHLIPWPVLLAGKDSTQSNMLAADIPAESATWGDDNDIDFDSGKYYDIKLLIT